MKQLWRFMAVKLTIAPAVLIVIITATHLVKAEFVLTVNFINYTNPTGLCAECETELESVTGVDQLVPVCCDESPFTSVNCNNTGEASCDTRFRWTIRPFGTSLETRPASIRIMGHPPYYFTDCNLPNATCPFSEMSTTFSQGPTGFLGVAANPLPVYSRNLTVWTGRVQFFIEAVDSGLPNIIDSLLINLDNLQLGADFIEEITFTGYHNISHMTMSFRVTCQTGFCGRDCTANYLNNPQILSCNNTSGKIVCTKGYDPSKNCESCFEKLDISNDCSTCLEPNFDLGTNCTACLPGYDTDNNCSTCRNTNYDPSTNCTMCLDSRFDPGRDCTSCLLEGYDPLTNCTQCLPNRDLSTNCTQCSPSWDISSNCMSCQLPHRDPSTSCTQCLPNRNPSTDCSTCLFGFDVNRDCSVCLPGRDISTNCTTCLSGYTGENCVPDTSLVLSVALVGGIAGGVVVILIVVILIMTVTITALSVHIRKINTRNTNATTDNEPVEAIQMKQNPVYGVTTTVLPQPSTDDTDTIKLQPNVLYGVSTKPDRCNQTTYYENEDLDLGSETNDKEPVETVQMEQNLAYHVTTVVPAQPSTDDTDTIKLQPNVLYGVSSEPDRGDQTNYYENEGLGPETKKQHEEYDYIELLN